MVILACSSRTHCDNVTRQSKLEMSSRSPSVSTPSPLRVASGRVVKKYQRIRALLDRGYCLQAQLQSAAFRSSYVPRSSMITKSAALWSRSRPRRYGTAVPITGLSRTGILRVRIDAAPVGRLYPVCGKY